MTSISFPLQSYVFSCTISNVLPFVCRQMVIYLLNRTDTITNVLDQTFPLNMSRMTNDGHMLHMLYFARHWQWRASSSWTDF